MVVVTGCDGVIDRYRHRVVGAGVIHQTWQADAIISDDGIGLPKKRKAI